MHFNVVTHLLQVVKVIGHGHVGHLGFMVAL